MSSPSPLDVARRLAAEHGFDLDDPVRIGGNYAPLVVHGGVAHVSGQVPRIGQAVIATGAVGDAVTLDEAHHAARVCVLRALAILHQHVGLASVGRVLRLNAFVRSAPAFTQHSEVADAASDLLVAVFGLEAGIHARTSVGVAQLPKGAAVELDVTVALTG